MLNKTRHDLGCMPWYFLILLTGNVVFAQSGGGYDLDWTTTAGGGVADGGGFELEGSIGAAESESLSGDGFELTGGFVQPPAGCGACQLFGDVVNSAGEATPDCLIDVTDLICVLDDFVLPGSCVSSADILSADFSCVPDGLVDSSDLLAMLDAFSGFYACPHPCSP